MAVANRANIGLQKKVSEETAIRNIGKAPFIFLLIYLCIEFVRPQYFVASIGVVRPGLVMAILLTFYWVSTWGPKHLFDDVAIRCYTLLVMFCMMWVPFALNNFWAWERTLAIAGYLAAATIPMSIILRNRYWRQRFVDFWVAVHVYLAIFGLTHYGRGPGSFLTDENDLALALGMGIPYPFLLSQATGVSATKRTYYRIAVLLMLVGIIWTNSRGGFVGLAAVSAYMLWLSKNKVRNVMLAMLLGIVALFFAPDSYIDEIRSITDTEDDTRSERIHQWRIAWVMFADNPVLGVGPGNYSWNIPEYQVQLDDYDPNERMYGGRAAHSLYFTLLPETGLVGVILFAFILFNLFKRLSRFEKRLNSTALSPEAEKDMLLARAIKASVFAYLSSGAFISVLYYPHLWYAIGFVVALCATIPEDTATPLPETD